MTPSKPVVGSPWNSCSRAGPGQAARGVSGFRRRFFRKGARAVLTATGGFGSRQGTTAPCAASRGVRSGTMQGRRSKPVTVPRPRCGSDRPRTDFAWLEAEPSRGSSSSETQGPAVGAGEVDAQQPVVPARRRLRPESRTDPSAQPSRRRSMLLGEGPLEQDVPLADDQPGRSRLRCRRGALVLASFGSTATSTTWPSITRFRSSPARRIAWRAIGVLSLAWPRGPAGPGPGPFLPLLHREYARRPSAPGSLAADLPATGRSSDGERPDPGVEQAQVVVDLRDRRDGAARVSRTPRVLIDGDRGRRQALDQIDVEYARAGRRTGRRSSRKPLEGTAAVLPHRACQTPGCSCPSRSVRSGPRGDRGGCRRRGPGGCGPAPRGS